MARKYRTHVTEKKAVEITLKVEGLNEYKDVWLAICNNAREYPTDIYKVYNSYNSNIYILVNPDELENAKSWLSNYGEILDINENKVAVFVDVSCDYDDFDKDYIDSEYVFGELD